MDAVAFDEEEFFRALEHRLARTRNPEEAAEIQALIDWFCRRCPTARERLAYVRRKSVQWRRVAGAPSAMPGD